MHAASRRAKAGVAPDFQARHFWAIANVIKNLPADVNRGVVAADFVAMLRYSNPNFNVAKFLEACGA